MPTSGANATWEGGLRGGNGRYAGDTGFSGSYNFGTRFGEDRGSNPEELLAAAHAACFSMALSGAIEKAGFTPQRVATTARCTVEKVGDGFTITKMQLSTRASVPGLEAAQFQQIAEGAKAGCPVSRALTGIKDVSLDAQLE